MIIYADVLIVTNMIINYFLLLLAAKLDRIQFASYRIILSAITGGIFSLYILFEADSTIIDISVKAACCIIMTLIAFGYKTMKEFLRSAFYLLTASFVFAGVMLMLCRFYENNVVLVNNSTVYFNVSVIGLIICAVIVYLAVSVILYFTHKKAFKNQFCDILIEFGECSAKLRAFFDTGNSLTDNFSNSAVVLVDKNALLTQTARSAEPLLKKRYRILPCKTVGGCSILEGFRADKMILYTEKQKKEFYDPIVMFSNTAIKDGYDAILNTEILC